MKSTKSSADLDLRNAAEQRIAAIDGRITAIQSRMADLANLPVGRAEYVDAALEHLQAQADRWARAVGRAARGAGATTMASMRVVSGFGGDGVPRLRETDVRPVRPFAAADGDEREIDPLARTLAVMPGFADDLRAFLEAQASHLPEAPEVTLAQREAESRALADELQALVAERVEQRKLVREAGAAIARDLLRDPDRPKGYVDLGGDFDQAAWDTQRQALQEKSEAARREGVERLADPV